MTEYVPPTDNGLYESYTKHQDRLKDDPSPWKDPELFKIEDLWREIYFLRRMDEKHGPNHTRLAIIGELTEHIDARRAEYGPKTP